MGAGLHDHVRHHDGHDDTMLTMNPLGKEFFVFIVSSWSS